MKRLILIAAILFVPQFSLGQVIGTCPRGFQDGYLIGFAHATGYDGAEYRSDILVTTRGTGTSGFWMRFIPRDAEPVPGLVPMGWLEASSTLEDYLGHVSIEGAGIVYVCVREDTDIYVRNRRSTSCGVVSEIMPMVSPLDRISPDGSRGIFPVVIGPSAWTNIGLLNVEEAPVTVKVTFFDKSGTILGALERTVPAGWNTQINRVLSEIGISDAREVRAEILPATGSIVAWASTVDGASGSFTTVIAK